MNALKHLLPHALGCALLAAAPAWAQPSLVDAIQACRTRDDPQLRLACYDDLRLPPAPPPGALRAAPPPVAFTPENFGFEQRTAKEALPSIESHIPGRFDGWGPRERIKLANGQVWQVIDDSNAVMNLRDPKVTVRRGALGAFYLEFEQSNRTARVRRVE
ncbi:hypothetical protein [Ideonella sp.]|uniref:hypothetical protein n=1 Tax=Ideonella sp. TaxID=1929293 RepID=UPI002B4A22F5|nr:hypothetical protein [Ideonella sp.]HJV72480.1 hypothetical protein [Ideonella sp.]